MNTDISNEDIKAIRRIGKKGDKTRPVVVTLTTVGKKINIIKNKKMLESTSYYIKEDFPPQVLQKRKELQEELKRGKAQGKNIVLKYDRIISLDENKNRNLSESPKHTAEKTNSISVKNQAKKKTKCSMEKYIISNKESPTITPPATQNTA